MSGIGVAYEFLCKTMAVSEHHDAFMEFVCGPAKVTGVISGGGLGEVGKVMAGFPLA